MSDKGRGLYNKFRVTRTDGAHRKGRKHHDCSYFVLDRTCDPFATPALLAYALACRHEYPELAYDLVSGLDVKYKPQEWCDMFDMVILDPDGWRGGARLGFKAYHEPISYREFNTRAMESTQMVKPSPPTAGVWVDEKLWECHCAVAEDEALLHDRSDKGCSVCGCKRP